MSEELKIDKGIPFPKPYSRPGIASVLRRMDVGDSVFIPDKTPTTASAFLSQRRPWKFTCRTVTENGVKGVRVWRIA